MSAPDSSGGAGAAQASKSWHLFVGLGIGLAAQLAGHSLAQGQVV